MANTIINFDSDQSGTNPLRSKTQVQAMIDTSLVSFSVVAIEEWLVTTVYGAGDSVWFKGIIYLTAAGVTGGASPDTNAVDWEESHNSKYQALYNANRIYVNNDIVIFKNSSNKLTAQRANTTTIAGDSPDSAPTKWENIGMGAETRIREAVQNIDGLQAINTTTAIENPDRIIVFVEHYDSANQAATTGGSQVLLALDKQSAVAEDLVNGIVKPTTGTGRWLKIDFAQTFDGIAPTGLKGKILVHNGTKWVALTVGADGLVVVADSTKAEGIKWGTVTGTGDFVGPGSASDNAILRFDGASGKAGQNSGVLIDDSNNITGAVSVETNTVTTSGATNLTLTTGGAGLLKLGKNLDVNGKSIVSLLDGDINVTPDGSGSVVLDGLKHPQADGTANQSIVTNASGQLSFATRLANLIEDLTPQFGGNVDINGKQIVSVSNGNIPIIPNGSGQVTIGTATPGNTNAKLYVERSSGDPSCMMVDTDTGGSAGYSWAFAGVEKFDCFVDTGGFWQLTEVGTGSTKFIRLGSGKNFDIITEASFSVKRSTAALLSQFLSLTNETNFEIIGLNSSTTFGSTNGGANLILRNNDTTNNNLTQVLYVNKDGDVIALAGAKNVNHTSDHGSYHIFTNDGTSLKERVVIDKDGNILMGAGLPDANAKLKVDGTVLLKSHVVASLPTVVSGGFIFVSDETGGSVPAFSDGTNWRRVTDRAIVA